MTVPYPVLLDRDGVINYASHDESSPLYYITRVDDLIIKPGVREAVALLRAHNIPLALATKQRCVSKGLVSREQVDIINQRVNRLLNANFVRIYVEEVAEDKRALYKEALADRGFHGGWNGGMVLFDDSPREIKVAQDLGIAAYDGSDLLASVKQVLHIS